MQLGTHAHAPSIQTCGSTNTELVSNRNELLSARNGPSQIGMDTFLIFVSAEGFSDLGFKAPNSEVQLSRWPRESEAPVGRFGPQIRYLFSQIRALKQSQLLSPSRLQQKKTNPVVFLNPADSFQLTEWDFTYPRTRKVFLIGALLTVPH
ncbi:hypothetical protein CEXT_541281 [Caerostris extrusa]|uniref:Uncharacterized protein n=1 Tax=Caerostris extrusa TaxID=172846 RepID=A0AAV4YD60_CAEEX|nr:hypothetical protein CEXT_541281 [Caerostris extrusa]